MNLVERLVALVRRSRAQAAGGPSAAAVPLEDPFEDPFEDSFDAYTASLSSLDQAGRARLAAWSQDILVFAEFLNGTVGDGVPVTACNQWPAVPRFVSALRRMDEEKVADLLEHAVSSAHERGLAHNGGCRVEGVWDDEVASGAFEAVEREIDARWRELWDKAEAYAIANGWTRPK